MDLKEIIASCLYDGKWSGQAEEENQRNFLKVRKHLNKSFVDEYLEYGGFRGWWLDGVEIWRADWAGKESAMMNLHLKKLDERIDLLFYGVEALNMKGELQPRGRIGAAEVLLLAFELKDKKLHCALLCREGFTVRLNFIQVISISKTENHV